MTAKAKLWAERVAEWRRSGQTSREFCEGKDYTNRALLWWSSQLNRQGDPPGVARGGERKNAVAFARVVPTSKTEPGGVVVRVGETEVIVSSGFDAPLLVEVVRALGALK